MVSRQRALMLLGMMLLAAASLLLCFMNNVAMLIVGRALQGLASALTWTIGLSIVARSADKSHVGRAMGWVTLSSTLGLTLAPLLGGAVYSAGGYRAVWIMCFALLAVDLLIRALVVEGHQSGNTELEATGTDAASCPANKLSRAQVRVILTSRRLPIVLALTAVEACILTGFDSTLPIFVQSMFEWGPLPAGLLFMSLAIPSFLGPLIGRWCDAYGPKWLLTCGFGLMAISMVSLRCVDEDTLADKVLLVCLLTGVGIGSAFVFGPVTVAVVYVVKELLPGHDDGPVTLAYALYNVAFSVGAVVGPILSGFILRTAGWQPLTLSVASIAAAASVLCIVAVKGLRGGG